MANMEGRTITSLLTLLRNPFYRGSLLFADGPQERSEIDNYMTLASHMTKERWRESLSVSIGQRVSLWKSVTQQTNAIM